MTVAADGTVWTAVNERDNIPYPSHGPYATDGDAFNPGGTGMDCAALAPVQEILKVSYGSSGPLPVM